MCKAMSPSFVNDGKLLSDVENVRFKRRYCGICAQIAISRSSKRVKTLSNRFKIVTHTCTLVVPLLFLR